MSMRYFSVWFLWCCVTEKRRSGFIPKSWINSKSQNDTHGGWTAGASSYFWSNVCMDWNCRGDSEWLWGPSLPVTHPDKHIHLQSFLPDPESSYLISPALMGRRKPQNCSYLQQSMKNPRDLSEPPLLLRNQNQPRLSATGLRAFANRDLTSLPAPWGTSPAYRMQLLDALIFSSLWACESPPITSVCKRDWTNSWLLPLCISFVHWNLFIYACIYLCIYVFCLQLALGS